VAEILERIIERGDQLCTSVLTLGELLVKPIEQGRPEDRQVLEDALTTHADLIPFDRAAAVVYAQIRQDRGVKPPDAVQRKQVRQDRPGCPMRAINVPAGGQAYR